MKKYLVFAWTHPRSDGPVDIFYGTTSGIDEDSYHAPGEEIEFVDNDGNSSMQSSPFGLAIVDKYIECAPNLMTGKKFWMKVLVSYSDKVPLEEGKNVIAFYEIPRSGA